MLWAQCTEDRLRAPSAHIANIRRVLLVLHRPNQEEQSLLGPAVTSLVLVLSVESRDCCSARFLSSLAIVSRDHPRLCSLLLRRFGALPHPSRVPCSCGFCSEVALLVSRVASHWFRSLLLLRSVVFICGFPWVYTVGTCSSCLLMASTKIG